ncbi:hypothetical protein ET532_013700 [Verminephrobacter sp. Larva24]|nr:hypothetical protein ET532_013700 [Verminephrobacter sp. Larva24]
MNMTRSLLKPALYQEESAPRPPSLRGMRCDACGYVFFPPQNLGCEQCGTTGSALLGVMQRRAIRSLAAALLPRRGVGGMAWGGLQARPPVR